MRCSRIPSTRLLSALALLPLAAYADEVKFGQPTTLDLEHHYISLISSSPGKDFLDPVNLGLMTDPASWKIRLDGKDVRVVKGLIDLDARGVRLEFRPGSFTVVDAADIPSGKLVVEYRGTPTIITTGKDAHSKPAKPPVLTCFKVGWAAAKDKKKADVDIVGGFQAGVGAKPQYNWSVKAGCSLYGEQALKFGELGPSFTAEASQQNNADPDSLKAGITWRKLQPIPDSRNGFLFSADLLSYEFERAIKKEAVLDDDTGKPVDQKFLEKNSNLMWTGKAAYVNGWRVVNFTLLGGAEAGKALTRTVKKASRSEDDQRVTRLLFSLDLYRTFFHKDKPVLTFHGNQILRLPFVQEPYTEADVNGGKMYLTNKPRHWSLIELSAPLTDGLGLSVQYKRGSLPPSFEFVDHQVTIGFELLLKHGS